MSRVILPKDRPKGNSKSALPRQTLPEPLTLADIEVHCTRSGKTHVIDGERVAIALERALEQLGEDVDDWEPLTSAFWAAGHIKGVEKLLRTERDFEDISLMTLADVLRDARINCRLDGIGDLGGDYQVRLKNAASEQPAKAA